MDFHKLSSYRGLIFDLDGTLIDSMPFHVKAWCQVAKEHGFEIDPNDIYRIAGSASIDIAEHYKKQGRPVGDSSEYVQRKMAIYRSHVDEIRIFEKIFDTLKKCRQSGAKIAIGTGSSRDNALEVLNRKGILDYVDVVITSSDVKAHKPNPDTFLAAADKMGLSPRECCVFEDGGLGLVAAVNGGFDCIEVSDNDMIRLYEIQR